jgi:hypothetical protein
MTELHCEGIAKSRRAVLVTGGFMARVVRSFFTTQTIGHYVKLRARKSPTECADGLSLLSGGDQAASVERRRAANAWIGGINRRLHYSVTGRAEAMTASPGSAGGRTAKASQ